MYPKAVMGVILFFILTPMKYQTILTCNAIFLITFNFASYWQNKINTQVTLYLSDVNTVCHFISFKDRSQTIGESQKPLNRGIATIAEQTVSIIIADDHTSDNLLPRIFLWLSDIAESTYYTVGIREYERTWHCGWICQIFHFLPVIELFMLNPLQLHCSSVI